MHRSILLIALIAGPGLLTTACDDTAASEPLDAAVDAGCTDCPPVCPPEDEIPDGLVCAPAGSFWMGTAANERPRFDDEERHLVTLTRPFFIGAHEVTQREWDAVMDRNPSWFQEGGDGDCPFEPCEDRPVERVNWYEALEYLNARSAAEGLGACYRLDGCTGEAGEGCEGDETCLGGYRCTTADAIPDCDGYRLPTEAEWEYATRAGTESAIYGPLDDVAWYVGTARQRTRPVGDLPANGWGLVDTIGNVAEWTADIYAMNYGFFGRPEVAVEDPIGEMFGDTRVVRGCGWNSPFRRPKSRPSHCMQARLPGVRSASCPMAGAGQTCCRGRMNARSSTAPTAYWRWTAT